MESEARMVFFLAVKEGRTCVFWRIIDRGVEELLKRDIIILPF